MLENALWEELHKIYTTLKSVCQVCTTAAAWLGMKTESGSTSISKAH